MPSSKEVFDQLKSKSHLIPPSPAPNGLYEMVTVIGDMAYSSGQLSRLDNGGKLISGKIRAEDELDDAIEAAKLCFVRGLVAMHEKLGDLDKIKRVVFIRGFFNADPDFSRHSEVLNHVSQMAIDIFGPENGSHSRSALGAGSLPSKGLVEIELVVQLLKP